MIHLKPTSYRLPDCALHMVFIAMVGDYLLTFWGIHSLGYIEEFNPWMVTFMQLPLYQGLALRVVYAGLLLLIIGLGLRKLSHRPIYNKIPIALLLVQSFPLVMHMIWLYQYFSA